MLKIIPTKHWIKIRSMKRLQNIWNKYHDPNKVFDQPLNPGKIFEARFILAWSFHKNDDGRISAGEWTNLFVVLKYWEKYGTKSTWYKKMKKGHLYLMDLAAELPEYKKWMPEIIEYQKGEE